MKPGKVCGAKIVSKYLFFATLFVALVIQLPSNVERAFAQTAPVAAPPVPPGASGTARKIAAATLKSYVGRYGLEPGVIPISTLDVTIDQGDLWIKPSLVKKRRLLPKSKSRFIDEIEGTSYRFNKDAEGRIVSLTFRFEGSDYTAPRIELPAPSLKGNTTFRLKGYEDAQLVVLAGSFNNWHESQLICGREGDDWVYRIDLEPGRYTYKFIIDGNWLLDPANPETESDDYGVMNNVLVVGK